MRHHRENGVARERDADRKRIPVIEERAHVGKRTVETGRVRVAVRETTTTQEIHARLNQREVTVESVPQDELLEEQPLPRQEGDTFIFPVAEQVVVTRWHLVEEVRVRATERTGDADIPVDLQRQEVVIERSPAAGDH